MLCPGRTADNCQPLPEAIDNEAAGILNPGRQRLSAERRRISFGTPDEPGREAIPVRLFRESEAPRPLDPGIFLLLLQRLWHATRDILHRGEAIPT